MRILGIAVEGLPHTLWRQFNERDRFAAREFWNEMDERYASRDDYHTQQLIERAASIRITMKDEATKQLGQFHSARSINC